MNYKRSDRANQDLRPKKTDDDRSYFLIRLPVHPEADLGDFIKTEGSEKTQVETQVETPDQIIRILKAQNPN